MSNKVRKYAVGFYIAGSYEPEPWERYALLTAEEVKRLRAYLESRSDFERTYVRPFDLDDLIDFDAIKATILEEYEEPEPEDEDED